MAQLPYDIGSQIKAVESVRPSLQQAGAINGQSIDRMVSGSGEGYESLTVLLSAGAVGGTPDSFTLIAKVQDSSDNFSADTTDFGTALATITAANTFKEKDFDLRGAKRYVRVVCTAAFVNGTSPSVGSAACMILGGASKKPA